MITIMIILSKMAVTDLYSHHETNEDVMRESRNTISTVGIVLHWAFVWASKTFTVHAVQ